MEQSRELYTTAHQKALRVVNLNKGNHKAGEMFDNKLVESLKAP